MDKIKKKRKSKGVVSPYKGRESRLFALWLSMPFALRELPEAKLRSMGYDVEDDEFMSLVKCKTRTEFSKLFGVHKKQLCEWQNSESVMKLVDEFNLNSNVLKFKKDIDYHFTNVTIREADAGRVKLWYQLFQGWQEKGQMTDPAMAEAIQEQTKVLQQLANRK